MAALLAGARLLLRQGARLLPARTRRPMAAAVRCLASSPTVFTAVAQKEGAESAPFSRGRRKQEGWSMHLVGFKMKRDGRISKQALLLTFEETCKTGIPNRNQAWFFLHACGSFMPEVPLAERTMLAKTIWNNLKELGVELNIVHYNTLLRVYLQNEHTFSPTEFLANMEEANVQPDKELYQGLIAAYCNEGDIDGASQILGFMKSKNLPVTEEVFNSLIKGHARAGQMESAETVPSIMRNAGIEPGWSTHLALLTAYAEKGDIEHIKQILNDSEKNVPQKQLTKVILALAKYGYPQYVADVIEHMPNCKGYSNDVINLCLTLLTQGYEDTALQAAKLLNEWKPADEESLVQPGDFFLRHCINLKMPLALLNKCADYMLAAEIHSHPKQYMLQYGLRNNPDLSLELMKSMKDQGVAIKARYFQSPLRHMCNKNDLPGIIEMIRNMKGVGVDVELDLLGRCMSCIFSEDNAGHAILQDKQCLEELREACKRSVRRGINLWLIPSVCLFLSKLPIPVQADLTLVRALGDGFLQRYEEVDMMVKITELLYKNGSASKVPSRPSESIGHLLVHLSRNMTTSEAWDMESHLRQYFHQLKEMGLSIEQKHYLAIQKSLESHGLPNLCEDVKILVKSDPSLMLEPVEFTAEMEEELVKLKSEGQDVEYILQNHLDLLRVAQDLPKALEFKSKYEESFTIGTYAKLLRMCCELNNPQEALMLHKEITGKFPSKLSPQKYIGLFQVLAENGLIEDAINILKEMRERDVPLHKYDTASFIRILKNIALGGDVQAVHLLHKHMTALDKLEDDNRLCSPLVMVHLQKNDFQATLDAIIKCIEEYKCAPVINNFIRKLLEKGETNLLKNVVDRLSVYMGEQWMLHELFFAFLQMGRYREAEKIVETPGLKTHHGKMNWFIDRCVRRNEVDLLEKLVDLSEKLFDTDRGEMYAKLFKLYEANDKWEKAKNTWYKMRAEKITADKTTLTHIQKLFEKNGQDIEVHIPELKGSPPILTSSEVIKAFCARGELKEAFARFLEMEQKNISLTKNMYKILTEALLDNGYQQEADEVIEVGKSHGVNCSEERRSGSNLLDVLVRRDCLKDALVTLETMLINGRKPKRTPLTQLITAFAEKGDLQSIEKITELKEHYIAMEEVMPASLDTNIVLAHLKSGNLEEGISAMEKLCLSNHTNIYTNFLVSRLMDDNMAEALEKVSILAERMANQFAKYRLVTDLFWNYVKAGRLEEARHLLQRCNGIVEQRRMLRHYILRNMIFNKQQEVAHLVELLADPYYKHVLYGYMMKGYVHKQDVEAALALYEKTKAEDIETDELFLKQLAVLLEGAGLPVPFSEPPESIKYYEEKLKEQSFETGEEQEEAI